MINYSYNPQGPSISRLDELLSRNELIYQNLKQKLDDINKSSKNIQCNISHIHSNYPQSSSRFGADSICESSAIQQEMQVRSLYSQKERNLSSINESNEITFSEVTPLGEEDEETAEQRLIDLLKEESRLREIQILLKRKRMMDEIQSQRSNRTNQIYYRDTQIGRQVDISRRPEITAQNQIQKHILDSSPAYFPTQIQPQFQVHASQPEGKPGKGNSIYLTSIPKTSQADKQRQMDTIRMDEMPTFRELVKNKQQEQQKRKEQQVSPSCQKEEGILSPKAQKWNKMAGKEVASKETLKRSSYKQPAIEYARQQSSRLQRERICEVNQLIETNRSHTWQQLSLPSNDIDYVAVSPKKSTDYRLLANNLTQNLHQVWNIPECYLFIPFNKVYRSPILQIKPGTVLLQRRSKTTPSRKDSRLSDPIKYKFKSVITDEQLIIKLLFGGTDSLDLTRHETKRVAILGKRDTLKKKLHLSLIAYLLQSAAAQISDSTKNLLIRIEHQQVGREGRDGLIDAEIILRIGGQRVALLQLQRAGEDVCASIKSGGCQQKVLRVSKVTVKGEKQWSASVVSSNRVDSEFVRCLGASRICWSVNPLIKNYEDVQVTLESMKKFVNSAHCD